MNNNLEIRKQLKIFNSFIFRKLSSSTTFGIFAILIVLCLILTIITERFAHPDNIFSVIRAFSYIAIMAIGECMVIITAGIDLSVGSIFGIAGVIAALSMHQWGIGIPLSILIAISVGLGFGIFNGLMITRVKLPPFIATLGTLSVARGLAYGITGGYTIAGFPNKFIYMGQGYIGPVPVPALIMIGLAIIFSIFLNRTIIGRRIYAIGGNEEAARISGIKVNNLKVIVYALSGGLAAIAGIVTIARLGVAQSTAGVGYELDVIAAVIIGGASVSGGAGSIFGAILGAAIMGVLRNGLVLLNVSAYWQQTVIGAVILLAVTADYLRRRKSI